MEEDIKILEDLIRFYERLSKNESFTSLDRNIVVRRIQALENLLKRNYYLENEARKIINQELNKAQIDLYKNYIPISVIQNTLDDINEKIEEFTNNVVTTKEEIEQEYWKSELNKAIAKRSVLQELLEERNK